MSCKLTESSQQAHSESLSYEFTVSWVSLKWAHCETIKVSSLWVLWCWLTPSLGSLEKDFKRSCDTMTLDRTLCDSQRSVQSVQSYFAASQHCLASVWRQTNIKILELRCYITSEAQDKPVARNNSILARLLVYPVAFLWLQGICAALMYEKSFCWHVHSTSWYLLKCTITKLYDAITSQL